MAYVTIDIAGTTYTFKDSKPYDGTHQYNIVDSDCYGRIEFDYDKVDQSSILIIHQEPAHSL